VDASERVERLLSLAQRIAEAKSEADAIEGLAHNARLELNANLNAAAARVRLMLTTANIESRHEKRALAAEA
jgi:hypothetical protein